MQRISIALVGERNEEIAAHRSIPRALALAGAALGVDVAATWLRSDAVCVSRDEARDLGEFSGIWCIPGSPYADMNGALAAIRHARERAIPFLGTCGGFQHAMIEYARNVLGIHDAEHAESAPDAVSPIVVPLACALVNVEARVTLAEGSRLAAAYGARETREEYQCRFGLDEAWRARLSDGVLAFTAFDAEGEVRGAELTGASGHPFFVATLFQPERAALRDELPPLVRAFVAAARDDASTR